jgi:hypothetical protein
MQRRGRLAARVPQVGLEAPAVAAVCVAVGVERGEHAVGRGPSHEHLEAPSVEQPPVGGEEVGCGF